MIRGACCAKRPTWSDQRLATRRRRGRSPITYYHHEIEQGGAFTILLKVKQRLTHEIGLKHGDVVSCVAVTYLEGGDFGAIPTNAPHHLRRGEATVDGILTIPTFFEMVNIIETLVL